MTSTARRICPALPRPINLQNETSLPEQTPLVPAVSVFLFTFLLHCAMLKTGKMWEIHTDSRRQICDFPKQNLLFAALQ